MRRGETGTHRRMSCDSGGPDWSDPAVGQGTPRTATCPPDGHQMLKRQGGLSAGGFRGRQPACPWVSASAWPQNSETVHFCRLKLPVRRALSWPLQEAATLPEALTPAFLPLPGPGPVLCLPLSSGSLCRPGRLSPLPKLGLGDTGGWTQGGLAGGGRGGGAASEQCAVCCTLALAGRGQGLWDRMLS